MGRVCGWERCRRGSFFRERESEGRWVGMVVDTLRSGWVGREETIGLMGSVGRPGGEVNRRE